MTELFDLTQKEPKRRRKKAFFLQGGNKPLKLGKVASPRLLMDRKSEDGQGEAGSVSVRESEGERRSVNLFGDAFESLIFRLVDQSIIFLMDEGIWNGKN
jgi:hypothetical protein